MILTDRELVDSLSATTCPACKRKKRRGETFCYTCYKTLPAVERNNLYRRLGSGYAEAFRSAFITLQQKGRVQDAQPGD